MKRTLFQFLNLMMACVVLLSSTGFGLLEHSCHMRGKKKMMVVAFTENSTQPGCASDTQPVADDRTTVKKVECCLDEQHYENIDISSSLSQFVAKLVKILTESVLTGIVTVFTWLVDWVFAEDSASVSVFSPPPSPSGRTILTLIQSLLI
ncbi:hypothetical protein [Spirosoma spitsbergense]|uniref:hypothetical protein n=1 Tax=Spirosoma spitsbergense TaxID=431554 RepID=UPI0003716595|nr:hypothetical protein [Spirosoma spitsbergense]